MESFICKYCGSVRLNANSLRGHERLCKSNPSGQTQKSNFIEYNRKVKEGRIKKKFTNQYDKAKKLGLPKPTVSKATSEKLSKAGKNQIWTEERREKHSKAMKNAVKKHPLSYSSENVCGRVRLIKYKGVKLKGSWEVIFAKWLDSQNIKWTEVISSDIKYSWKGREHIYFPDFYLPDKDLYVEVKGYERERDWHKWKALDNLVVIKRKDIDQIIKGTYQPRWDHKTFRYER